MLVYCERCNTEILTEANPHLVYPTPSGYHIFCWQCGLRPVNIHSTIAKQPRVCPACGKNANDEVPKEWARILLKNAGLKSEHCNPGGRELTGDFGRIQVFDYCSWCDYEIIKEKLGV